MDIKIEFSFPMITDTIGSKGLLELLLQWYYTAQLTLSYQHICMNLFTEISEHSLFLFCNKLQSAFVDIHNANIVRKATEFVSRSVWS